MITDPNQGATADFPSFEINDDYGVPTDFLMYGFGHQSYALFCVAWIHLDAL
jgi:hypothetical protein